MPANEPWDGAPATTVGDQAPSWPEELPVAAVPAADDWSKTAPPAEDWAPQVPVAATKSWAAPTPDWNV